MTLIKVSFQLTDACEIFKRPHQKMTFHVHKSGRLSVADIIKQLLGDVFNGYKKHSYN